MRLANKLASQIADEELNTAVAVGESGYNFAIKLAKDCTKLPMTTIGFSREREKRDLVSQDMQCQEPPFLIDDLAVSGRTLAVANDYVTPGARGVGVGMLFKSSSTRRLIDITDVRAAMIYEREGGGRPPINSLASLQNFPERSQALAERYFEGSQAAFCDAIAQAETRV